MSGVANPERITGAPVSAALFDTLRVAPALGRSFSREEDQGTRPVAILTDALWRRHFGADPSIVGRAILLKWLAYTVVGVMPRGFAFPNRGPSLNNVPADIYVQIQLLRARADQIRQHVQQQRCRAAEARGHTCAGRRRSAIDRHGATPSSVPATLKDLAGAISASVTPLRDETVGRVSTLLYVLFGAIAVVLLIACADIATLILTRAVSRQREMAVRAALGAGRRRLITQALVESALLCTGGVVFGFSSAEWLPSSSRTLLRSRFHHCTTIRTDIPVLAFTVALTIGTTLVCGVVPALEGSRAVSRRRVEKRGPIWRAGPPPAADARRTRDPAIRALDHPAAAGGLLVRSFAKLTDVDPGFQPDRVLTLATSLPATRISTRRRRADVLPPADGASSSASGVTAASGSTALPLAIQEHRAFTIENESTATRTLPTFSMHDWVLGQYFETLGIALKRGRFLSGQDHAGSEPVVVINETMARRFWPDRDPVGQRIAWGGPAEHGPWMRVVGVVADVKQGALNAEDAANLYRHGSRSLTECSGKTFSEYSAA